MKIYIYNEADFDGEILWYALDENGKLVYATLLDNDKDPLVYAKRAMLTDQKEYEYSVHDKDETIMRSLIAKRIYKENANG